MTTPAHVTKLRELGFTVVKLAKTDPAIHVFDVYGETQVAQYTPSMSLEGVMEDLKTKHLYVTSRVPADERQALVLLVQDDLIVFEVGILRLVIWRGTVKVPKATQKALMTIARSV